jgi:hypothetical protein
MLTYLPEKRSRDDESASANDAQKRGDDQYGCESTQMTVNQGLYLKKGLYHDKTLIQST